MRGEGGEEGRREVAVAASKNMASVPCSQSARL